MKSLNLKSFDELQTMLDRIDTHRRTVAELDYTREDILEELNSRVDEVPNRSVGTSPYGVPYMARRSYFR